MTESPQKNTASTAITIIAVLGVLYTLYFARTFLIPIAIAVLLAFVLSPAVRFLTRLRIPEWLGSAIVVIGLVGAFVLGAYQLAGPVQAWTAEAPATLPRPSGKSGSCSGRWSGSPRPRNGWKRPPRSHKPGRSRLKSWSAGPQ